MPAAGRALHVVAIVLAAVSVRAQTSASPDAVVQDLLSHTRAGQEQSVPCDRLDAGIAQALIDFGQQSRTVPLERLTTAYRLAERAARCAGADRLVGAALNALSDVLLERGQFDAARAAAQESVEIHGRLHDEAGLAEAWNRVGNLEWWVGNMPAALASFGRAVEHTPPDDRVGQARAWNNIANVYKGLDDFDAALDYYGRALSTFEEIGDRARTSVVINNIGDVHFRRGEFATALDFNARALAINRALGNEVRLAASLDLAANIHRARGAYDAALRAFGEALTIRTNAGDRLGAMETTHNIGLVHFAQGDYELAIAAYKQALHQNQVWDLRDQMLVAEALRNIALASWRIGQRDRAVANLRASLAIAEHEHRPMDEAAVVNDLGEVALAGGRVARAADLFSRALDIRRRVGDQAGITETLSSQASTRLAARQPGEALRLARAAADNATLHDQPDLLWNAQTLIGVAYRRLGRPADAREALGDAVRTIEQLSTHVGVNENLRQQFFENKLSPYHELIALLVDQRAFEEAVEIAERSKARALTRLLQRSSVDEVATLTADEKRERLRLRDRLVALNGEVESRRSKQPVDETAVTALESERRHAREALASFDALTAAAHPEIAASRGDVKPLDRPAIGQLLTNPATAIVEFVVTDQRLFTFVVSKHAGQVVVDHHVTAIASERLAEQTLRFRDRIAARDFDVLDEARALYDLLIAPVARSIVGKPRLIIVPDGPLWNVPFQALRGPDGFLVESSAVSYAPSMTTLREILRTPRPAGPHTLLAMGKTAFAAADGAALDPLPDAVIQVNMLREVYGEDRSATYVNDKATERQFRTAAPRFSVLHLATHGVLDESSPMYSYVALSPSADRPDDDGRLEALEIMGMRLRADVVVLAACDTGRGRVVTGEGVIGTMWAFFAAGTRSLVVSQFRIESKSTTALLVAFHRRLAADGGSKSDDLRAAALDLLHSSRFAHPYYWAGFVLVGDPD